MSRTDNNEVKELFGKILHETAKAILFSPDVHTHSFDPEHKDITKTATGEIGFWFPLSQVKQKVYGQANFEDDSITVKVWLIETKGIDV